MTTCLLLCFCSAALNILMVDMVLKLIDLDAATVYTKSQCVSSKGSTAYCPPEMIRKTDSGKYIRLGTYETGALDQGEIAEDYMAHLSAHPAQDMWFFFWMCFVPTVYRIHPVSMFC